MKTLFKIGFVLVLVLVLVAGGGAFFLINNINSIIANYKPDLERIASESLGSTVTLGNITASVFPRTSMVVDNVKVIDEAHPEEPLTLSNVNLHLELIPLLSRQVVINELAVRDPNIVLILDENGIFVGGLPRDGGTNGGGGESESSGDGESDGDESTSAPIDVELKRLAFENVTVTLRDTLAGVDYAISETNVSTAVALDESSVTLSDLDIVGIALDGIDFAFSGAAVNYDLKGGSLKVSEMDGEFLGNKMSVAGGLDPKNPEEKLVLREEATQLASLGPIYDNFAPGLHDLNLGGSVSAVLTMWLTSDSFQSEGTIELDGVEATVGEFLLADLTGPMQLQVAPEGQRARTEKITGTIGGAPMAIAMDLRANPERGRIDPLTVSAFSGEAKLLTTLMMGGSNKFRSELTVANMRVEEMIPALAPDLGEVGLTGLIESARGDVRGVFDETMTESMKGDLEFRFVDGLLEGVNVAKESLGELTALPIVQGAITQYVPERFQEALTSDRTVLNLVSGTFKLKDEKARTKDLYVESTYFTMDGVGEFGMDSSVNLDATIRFSQEFSAALAKSIRELEYIYQGGRLVFPIHIEGISPDLEIKADTSELLKDGVKNAVTEEVQDRIQDEVGNVLRNLLDE